MKGFLHVVAIAVLTLGTHYTFSQANVNLSNLSSTSVNANIVPGLHNTRDLGSGTLSWRNIHASSGFYLNDKRVVRADPASYGTFLGITNNTSNTGIHNAFVGHNSGESNTSGIYNTGTGSHTLNKNVSGNRNTAFGAFSLYSNTNGDNNIGIGYTALYFGTGSGNVAIGSYTLSNLTNSGSYNIAIGTNALEFGNGSYDIGIGSGALANSIAGYNTAIGYEALNATNTGYYNTATGYTALWNNADGIGNTATGTNSLQSNSGGDYSAAFGYNALAASDADYNTAFGAYALSTTSSGYNNTGIGTYALNLTTTAYGNTALGYNAGGNYNNSFYNTFIGTDARANAAGYTNSTALGRTAQVTASNQVRIGNTLVTSIGGWANWTNISDRRVKKNIKSNVPGLAFINQLQPVTYNLDLNAQDKILHTTNVTPEGKTIEPTTEEREARKRREQTIYSGFIAQDVEKAAQQLGFDFSGVDAAKNDKDLYGLRYAEFVVPLVKAVQELSAENEDLKRRLSELETFVKGSRSMTTAKLEQNVPNPADGSCSISYYIPSEARRAELVFTDALGRVLKAYRISNIGFGKQTINKNDLASGMYQYTLIVDGKVAATKSMIMAR